MTGSRPTPAAGSTFLFVLTALLLLSWNPSRAAGSSGSDSTARPPLLTLTRGDAWYWVGAGVAIGGTAFADIKVRERALTWNGETSEHVADVVRYLPLAAGTAAVLGYVGGRAFDHPELADASRRIGTSMAVVAVATELIKWPVGRVRPDESDTETDNYQPFSGHASFPSGHTSLAFAWAAAVDRETHEGWVPWLVYPLASLVGWSRIHDDKHWASDVVAGAALGGWGAWKTEDYLRARDGAANGSQLGLGSSGGAPMFVVHVAF